MLVAASIALTASVALTLWALAGLSGFGYLAIFLITCAPGLPVGFALFGRRHIASWLTGLVFGYAVTSLIWWAVVFAGRASTSSFAAAWAAATLGMWLLWRSSTSPVVTLPAWTRRDSTAFVLLMLLVPALMGRPYATLGSLDDSGNHQYRAYFIADFVWHTAMTAELAKEEARPRNPFLSNERVHYYWTYFRVPATIAARTGVGVQDALKLNAFATALLLVASIYMAAWAALPAWPFAVAMAVALTTLGASAEGLAAIADVLRRGLPLSELRDLNIDAIAAWAFNGLRIDDLPRTMWYTPQHGSSCALGLLSVPIALAAGVRARPSAIVLAGGFLAASLMFNPLLGGTFCAVYGFTVLADMLRTGGSFRDLVRHALAVVPVVLAVAWCAWNEVGEGAGSALHFGFWGLARNATVLSFLLQFGPILIPMAFGLWPKGADSFASMWPAIAGVTLAVLIMHLIALTVDPAWVGFRGGNIFFALAPALVARGFVRLWQEGRRRIAIAIATIVVVTGFPTTVIDAYNTQDVTNRHLWRDAQRARGEDVPFDPATEYRWTLTVTPGQWEALMWIRSNTPLDAVVQAEPIVRGRETWSLIPTFAERRMATGNALPLIARSTYTERNERVRQIYASNDARSAWQEAKALGIDYLYADDTERMAYPAVSKFDAHPEYFSPVFRNAEAAVYALRK